MEPKIELAKSRDFGETINDTFVFIKQNFGPLLKNFAIFCGFFIVAETAAGIMMQIKMVHAVNNLAAAGGREMFSYGNSTYTSPEFWLAILFSFIAIVCVNIMVLCYMAIYKEKGNQTPTTEEVWGYFKYYFFKAIGSWFLSFIIIIIGTAFCLLPGIYLGVVLSLLLSVMIFENTGFGYAFNRSFGLIKDYWWQTFGCLIIIAIVYYFMAMVVILPTSLVTGVSFALRSQKGGDLSITMIVVAGILAKISHVFSILPCVTVGLCYFNLTEIKEGAGLMGRITKFGTNAPDTNLPSEEY